MKPEGPDTRQSALFMATAVEPPSPYQAHSDTSEAAAEAIKPEANTLRHVVLRHIQLSRSTGMTDEEIQDATGMNPSTERPRRIELVRSGHVEHAGFKRPTRSGVSASVWIARVLS